MSEKSQKEKFIPPVNFRNGPMRIKPGGMNSARMNPVKPKNFKGTLKRLWQYFKNEHKLLIVVLAFVVIDTVICLSVPYFIGRSIDALSDSKGMVNFRMIWIMTGTLLIAYIMDALISFFQEWLMAGISQRIVMNLRQNLFKKLQKLPISFFDNNTHGDVMSRLTNDIDNVSSSISQSTTQLIGAVISIVGSLTMMFILSFWLTIASVITIPIVILFTRTITNRTRTYFKQQQIELGQLNSHIEEAISGIQIIKAFNQEDKVIQDFEEINQRLYKVALKAQIWSGYLMPMINVLNNLSFAIIAAVGGALVVKDMITVGVIASFLSYSKQFSRPLNSLANIYNTIQSAIAGAERVFEIIDEEEESENLSEAIELKDPKGKVVFQNVTFQYGPGVPVLKNISFTALQGSTIALVGPTGAGKTTIVNLLTRFYDVSAGNIFIDNVDIRQYKRESLRKYFGIVLQDTYLFSGTIKENIKYGRLEASDKEIEAAAKMANAHTFISKLPMGYDTILWESGSNLSQGQRQLLAISRAILSEPSILILDEATSSVDTRTELHIQEAMLKLMKGRTSFIIAHRLSTIRDADMIMVIDEGEIKEKGDHYSLIKEKGIYFNMYYNQLLIAEN